MGIRELLHSHLLDNFTEEAYEINSVHKVNQNVFTNPNLPPLHTYELELLKELIWLINNLTNQGAIAYDFACDHFPQHIYLLTLIYHQQFDFNLWRVIVWNMRMMSSALIYMENPNLENQINMYWLSKFKDVICGFLQPNQLANQN